MRDTALPAAVPDRPRTFGKAVMRAINDSVNAKLTREQTRDRLKFITTSQDQLDAAVALFERWRQIAHTPASGTPASAGRGTRG